jgi:hypothetical protein
VPPPAQEVLAKLEQELAQAEGAPLVSNSQLSAELLEFVGHCGLSSAQGGDLVTL